VNRGMQKGGQAPSQAVDHRMGHVLRTRSELKHRDDLGEGVDGQPEPLHLRLAAQPYVQFIQLHVRELEGAEIVRVKGLSVLASTRQPGGDGRLPGAEDPRGCRRVQPFCKRGEHHGDLVGGRFQTIERRVASSAKCGAARLAAEGLDRLSAPMLAVPDKRMDASVCLAKVLTLRIRTSEPFGVDAFGGSPLAFHLTPGTHRHWRWLSSRRGGGGESTGGAIIRRARLQQTVKHGAFGRAL